MKSIEEEKNLNGKKILLRLDLNAVSYTHLRAHET